MTEEKPRTEMIIPEFRKLPTTLNKAPRCVDGRPDYSIEDKGPQMLGGSLHPVVLWALEQGKPINQETVNQSLSVLKGEPNNFNLGDHRDTHTHDGHDACGCGFADRLPDIIKMAQDQRKEITTTTATDLHKKACFFRHIEFLLILSIYFNVCIYY